MRVGLASRFVRYGIGDILFRDHRAACKRRLRGTDSVYVFVHSVAQCSDAMTVHAQADDVHAFAFAHTIGKPEVRVHALYAA